MFECIQVYDSAGEQAGLYRFNTALMSNSDAYEKVESAWSKHHLDDEAFDEALADVGIERIYVTVEINLEDSPDKPVGTKDHTIKWKNSGESQNVTFGIGEVDPEIDDEVFFWVESFSELLSFKLYENGQDFHIVK